MDLIQISEAAHLFTAQRQAQEIFGCFDIWWRGHSKSEWKLVPAIYRPEARNKYKRRLVDHDTTLEVHSYCNFMQNAPLRAANCPRMGDYLGWLFLMQHHGILTRLLYWSMSVLVASHFAVNEYQGESPGTLCALKPFELNRRGFGDKANVVFSPEQRELIEIAKPGFKPGSDPVQKIAAMIPTQVDARMLVQLSRFTIHGYEVPLDHLPESDKFLLKFAIPANSKKRVFVELENVGIRTMNLFPDLDHLAEDII